MNATKLLFNKIYNSFSNIYNKVFFGFECIEVKDGDMAISLQTLHEINKMFKNKQ